MTDSMKFGPEWLRNLSADSVNNSHGSNTSNGGHSFNYPSSNQQKEMQNPISGTSSRNLFPEFRYGREEMLSLFDKNCSLPEILPCYKNLFVEKVQFPLAMTPCTEDEITVPNIHPANTRSTWLQRSQGSFSTSARSTTRGGLVDRGRIRGKPAYHSSYTRTSNFEDEPRSANVLRPERNWSDRNGTNGENLSGSSLTNSDWNGSTSASPRRDFSSHRSHENWRKIRSEENSSEISHTEGWRNIGTNSTLNASRWGRSTSWRDEETSNVTAEPGTTNALQRSLSSSASMVERSVNNFFSTQSKNATIYEGSNNNDCKVGFFGAPTVTSKMNLGTTTNLKKGENVSTTSGMDNDDLPEWAIENPSNAGGTFDALGAFHGSGEFDSKNCTNSKNISPFNQPSNLKKSTEKFIKSDSNANEQDTVQSFEESSLDTCKNSPANYIETPKASNECTPDLENHLKNKIEMSDISDQMKEVTDDMIKKLIMDDEIGDTKTDSKPDHFKSNENDHFHEQHSNNTLNPDLDIKNNMAVHTSVMKVLNEGKKSYVNEPMMNVVGETADDISASPQLVHNMTNPRDLWFYRDPQSKVQGPFTAIEMTEWFKAGYFNETLFVRRLSDVRFRALGDLIKMCNGLIPFTNNHLLPIDLDNYQFGNNYGFPERFPNCEDLKGNVTAAADSVSSAIKNGINNVDMTNMLNIHFQMLQEQYVAHQESIIFSELSKNEYFQRLSKAEKDAIVKQRVCIPDYLSSLSALSNSLSTINPSAGDQLYNVLAECSKKEQMFSNFNNVPHCHPINLHSALNEDLVLSIGEKKTSCPGPSEMSFEASNLSSNIDISSKILSSENLYMANDSVNNFNNQLIENDETKNVPKYSPKVNNLIFPEPELINPVVGNSNHLFPKMWVPNLNDSVMKSPLLPTHVNCINNQWNVELIPSISLNVGNENKLNVNKAPSLSMWNVADIEKIQINHLQAEKIEAEQKDQTTNSTTDVSKFENGLNSNIQEITPTSNISKNNSTPLITKQEKFSNRKTSKTNQTAKQTKEELSKLKEKDFTEDKKKVDKKRMESDVSRRAMRELEDTKASSDRKKPANVNLQQASHENLTKIKDISESRIQSSVAPWSNHGVEISKNGPCLAEIQKAERREKRADHHRLTEQSLKTCINLSMETVEPHPTWNASPIPVKSIAEIQAEEAKRLSNDLSNLQKKKEQEITNSIPSVSKATNNVWLGKKVWSSNHISLWDDKKIQHSSSSTSVKMVQSSNTLVKNPNIPEKDVHSASNEIGKKSPNSNSKKNPVQPVGIKKNQRESSENKRANTKKNSSASLKNSALELENEFTNWCLKSLNSMNTIVDVPTFVTFLQDLESPYEVKDYIRMYLGESKESNEFSKQFLERRSKYKNMQRAQNAHNDDMCKPAPALTPSLNDSSDNKIKNKKVKKSKMTKLDSRILGFSVTAAEGRINVGDRDYVEGP